MYCEGVYGLYCGTPLPSPRPTTFPGPPDRYGGGGEGALLLACCDLRAGWRTPHPRGRTIDHAMAHASECEEISSTRVQ